MASIGGSFMGQREKPLIIPQPGKDFRMVSEFREKLHKTEELISKLAFSLREIQAQRRVSR